MSGTDDKLAGTLRDRLRGVPLFRELGEHALDELAEWSRVTRLKRKTMIFAEGEPYRGMFVLLEGLAVVYKLSGDGRMLILRVCRAGDSMAELQLFEEADAGYSAHARTTRDSEVLFLPRERFVPFLKRHPEVGWELMRRFAGRLKDMSLKLEGVTLREVSSRLAQYLVREVEAAGLGDRDAPSLTLPLAKGSIASYLGTVHETLSRTLARLIKEKIIKVEGPQITVLDMERLKRLV
jgi:CRP/FNR family transcriptional regulator